MNYLNMASENARRRAKAYTYPALHTGSLADLLTNTRDVQASLGTPTAASAEMTAHRPLSSVMRSNEWRHRRTCPFLDVVLPGFTRSSSATFNPLFPVEWSLAAHHDDRHDAWRLTVKGPDLRSDEDSDLLPYLLVYLMLSVWHQRKKVAVSTRC